jgi:2-polyprenyl-6-methoxyphenol hydroxylase-like FAD-dependent oxidoreductase
MLLARKGYQVLLTDRAHFPSDLAMSTHLIWQSGAERLRRWGLLDRIAASNCPPLLDMHLDLGPLSLDGVPTPANCSAEAYSPRRVLLDQILVEGAVAAGAELREGFAVSEVMTEGDRVVGIRGSTQGGSQVSERARIVVGADGSQSVVARAVQAQEYNTRPPLQGTYFTYWSGVPIEGIHLYPRPQEHCQVYGWRTNDELTLIGVNWPIQDFPEARADIGGRYFAGLDLCAPQVAERVRSGVRAERWIGGAIRNFLRQPVGNGWALVGDAGWTVDPCTAAGINNAFRDAELLAQALDDGLADHQRLPAALSDYHRRRDEAALPIYEFTCQLAPLEPPPPEMQQLFGALASNPAETNRFFGLFAQTMPVGEFFAPENLVRIIGSG